MRVRKFLLIIGIFLSLSLSYALHSANIVNSNNKIKGWSWTIYWTISPYELYPGVNGYAEISLENTGDTDLHIYRVWFQWEWQGEYAYYTDVDVYLDPGEKKNLGKVYFSIPTNLEPDYYSYRIGVSQKHKEWYGWVDDGLEWMEGWKTERILSAPDIEIIYCSFDSNTILEEETATLRIKVKNQGEATAEYVYVKVSEPDGLWLVDSSSYTIPSLSGGSIYEVTFRYAGDKPGTYQISVTVTSSNAGSDSATASITVQESSENPDENPNPSTPAPMSFGIPLGIGVLALIIGTSVYIARRRTIVFSLLMSF